MFNPEGRCAYRFQHQPKNIHAAYPKPKIQPHNVQPAHVPHNTIPIIPSMVIPTRTNGFWSSDSLPTNLFIQLAARTMMTNKAKTQAASSQDQVNGLAQPNLPLPESKSKAQAKYNPLHAVHIPQVPIRELKTRRPKAIHNPLYRMPPWLHNLQPIP